MSTTAAEQSKLYDLSNKMNLNAILLIILIFIFGKKNATKNDFYFIFVMKTMERS